MDEIVWAYRGQARVGPAFRNLQDPRVGALRSQFHWTDQKLVVHALLNVLLRRAQGGAQFVGTTRTLVQRRDHARACTVIDVRAKPGVHALPPASRAAGGRANAARARCYEKTPKPRKSAVANANAAKLYRPA